MSCSAWSWYVYKVNSKNRDCIREIIAGSQCKTQEGGNNFNGEGVGEGGGLPLCNIVVLKLYCLTGYCKRF